MKMAAYLEKRQPILYQSFVNALGQSRVPHAYLLSGEMGVPLKEIAFFMAKSLLCLNPSPLADDECKICQRVDHRTYGDLMFLDGSERSIKKDDVLEVVGNFSKTPLEARGILVYIIHLVENMTVEAINSLLKFLEEPKDNTYAILTTNNEARVLPTVVSRSETVRLLLAPRDEVIEEAKTLGANLLDAELLSFIYNSAEVVKRMSDDDIYLRAKTAALITLEALLRKPSETAYTIEWEVIPMMTKREEARLFLDLLSFLFKDLLSLEGGRTAKISSWEKEERIISRKLRKKEEALREILKCRAELDLNISPSLIIEHLIGYFA